MVHQGYHNHIKVFLSAHMLTDITQKLLLRYQAMKKSEGYSNRTVNIQIGIIRKVMNYAVSQDYIRKVEIKFPKLKEPQKLHAFIEDEDFQLLIDNLTVDIVKKRVIFGRHTGLRPGELAFLEWSDVNLKRGVVKIQSKPEWTPKTGDERVVELNNTALGILKELYPNKTSRWVFSDTDKPVLSIKKSLEAASRRAGLSKKVTPNMTRHTFGTMSLHRGADLKSIQTQMGHGDIKTTGRYLHNIKGSVKKAVEVLDE